MENNDLYNPEAEEAVLGAVLINPTSFATMGIEPSHFFLGRHQYIWQVYTRLYSAGRPIDFITVVDELQRADQLGKIGGETYIMRLINRTPSSLRAEQYADIVKDYSRRRIWRDTAGQIAKTAFDKDSNLEEQSGVIIDQLLHAVRVDGAAVHVSEFADRVLDEALQRQQNPGQVWGLQTGFHEFDSITGGLQLGEILDISGLPGIGKSILAMQAGFQLAANGEPGAIYSIEMRGEAVVRRRISFDSKVPTRNIKSGFMDAQQAEAFVHAVSKYDNLPLYISDAADLSTTTMRADLTRLKIQYGIKWFAVDYAFLLQDGAGLNDTERSGLISTRLKNIARALNLAGIVIHSMTKAGMDALIPEGQHLRGSGQVYYDADVLIFMVDDPNKNTIKCIFGKGRELEKPREYFELVRLPGFPALADVAKEKEQI